MQKKDIGLGAVSIAFGAWVWYMAAALKKGADFWPKIVAGSIILLGLIILVMALMEVRSKGAEDTKKTKGAPQYLQVLEIIAVLLGYYVAFQYVGYTIPTFLLIFLSALILGYRNWKIMIPTSLIVSVGLYLIFTQLFGIRFPGSFF